MNYRREVVLMKTRGLVMAIIALLLMVSFKVWSHGGRLNSEGCHIDTKAKQYHCHKANAKADDQTGNRGNKTLGQSSLSGIYNRDNWSFRSSAVIKPWGKVAYRAFITVIIGVFDRLHRLYRVHL